MTPVLVLLAWWAKSHWKIEHPLLPPSCNSISLLHFHDKNHLLTIYIWSQLVPYFNNTTTRKLFWQTNFSSKSLQNSDNGNWESRQTYPQIAFLVIFCFKKAGLEVSGCGFHATFEFFCYLLKILLTSTNNRVDNKMKHFFITVKIDKLINKKISLLLPSSSFPSPTPPKHSLGTIFQMQRGCLRSLLSFLFGVKARSEKVSFTLKMSAQ